MMYFIMRLDKAGKIYYNYYNLIEYFILLKQTEVCYDQI